MTKNNLKIMLKKFIALIIIAALVISVNLSLVLSKETSLDNNYKITNKNMCHYIITIYIEGNGLVVKNPDQTEYTPGTVVELTAVPDSCWSFSHWSGDLSGNNNPELITMDSDKTVTAHFIEEEFDLTINTVGNGNVIKNPDQYSYPCNTVVELTANPDIGWIFSHWSGDLSGSNNPEFITMDTDKTVTTHFIEDVEFTLNVNIEGNGSVIKNPDQITYPSGTIVELTAVPDDGWTFSHWSENLTGSNNPETIIMDSNKSVIAHFVEGELFTLTLNIEGNGSVIKNPDQITYPSGTIVELTAVPDDGWGFSHWSGDLNGSINPEYITMDSNKTVTAHFAKGEYTLTIIIEGDGTVIKDPDQTLYINNSEVELTAVPDDGWTFSHWSENLTGSNNPETIIMDSNKSVIAHFIQDEYTLTININGNGSVTKVPDQITYTYGSIVDLTAIPDNNWIFDHWSGDLTGNDSQTSILIDGNKIVNAHFKFEGEDDNNPPEIKITKPKMKHLYRNDKERRSLIFRTRIIGKITIEVDAFDDESGVERVEFYINNKLKNTDYTQPYSWTWKQKYLLPRLHKIKVVAYDNAGNENSEEIKVWKLSDFNFIRNHPILSLILISILLLNQNDENPGESNIEEPEEDENRAPYADINVTLDGIIDTPIQFDGSKSYDPDGDTLIYEWDFGDGTAGTGVILTKSYSEIGEYTVTLTVSDPNNNTNSVEAKIKISNSKSNIISDVDNSNMIWYVIGGVILMLVAIPGSIFLKRKLFA